MKMSSSPIKEDFIHYLWKTKKIPTTLISTQHASLQILDFGTPNVDAGPDFFNGKIMVDDAIWAGNIEMHVLASDWHKHGHSSDKAYDNVILHVVYEDDLGADVLVNDRSIPTLELRGKIPKSYLDTYLTLVQSVNSIPCQALINQVDPNKIDLWKYTLSIERLQQKSSLVTEILAYTGQNWEEALYIMIARYFGSKVNTLPFEMTAKGLPLSILLKNQDKRESLDALIFGQAGMLDAHYKDDYFQSLQEEYAYQRKKYQLKPIDGSMWKFSKLRPMNFPTVRLAQFAGLIGHSQNIFSQIRDTNQIENINQIFECEPSSYWQTHYRFGVESPISYKKLSEEFIQLIMINAVSPVLYTYGQLYDEPKYIDKAINILELLDGEVNVITKGWKSLGVSTKSAFDTQSLIHLSTHYCKEHRCVSCKIGHEIMGR